MLLLKHTYTIASKNSVSTYVGSNMYGWCSYKNRIGFSTSTWSQASNDWSFYFDDMTLFQVLTTNPPDHKSMWCDMCESSKNGFYYFRVNIYSQRWKKLTHIFNTQNVLFHFSDLSLQNSKHLSNTKAFCVLTI